MRWLVPKLVEQGELRVKKRVQEKLIKVSAATVDRLPRRTFSEWNEGKPGFLEIDLVEHDGGNSSGEYLYSLNATDVASGWVETEALRNRAQIRTFQALERIK